MEIKYEKLIEVLEQAQAAHHEYEQGFLIGARDELWASWYASFTVGRLNSPHISPTGMTQQIIEADEAYQNCDSEEEWGVFVAQYILDNLPTE